MRISECLGLHWCDVLLPSDHGAGTFLILLLRKSKRGSPDSGKLVVRNARVVAFFERYKKKNYKNDSHALVIGCSYDMVRRWLRKGLVTLGLDADAGLRKVALQC